MGAFISKTFRTTTFYEHEHSNIFVLQCFSSAEFIKKPRVTGIPYKLSGSGYNSGGPGYVMSTQNVATLVTKAIKSQARFCPATDVGSEDQSIGKCLGGVKFFRNLFFIFHFIFIFEMFLLMDEHKFEINVVKKRISKRTLKRKE